MWFLAGIWCASFAGGPICDTINVTSLFQTEAACFTAEAEFRAVTMAAILKFDGEPFYFEFGCIKVAGEPA